MNHMLQQRTAATCSTAHATGQWQQHGQRQVKLELHNLHKATVGGVCSLRLVTIMLCAARYACGRSDVIIQCSIYTHSAATARGKSVARQRVFKHQPAAASHQRHGDVCHDNGGCGVDCHCVVASTSGVADPAAWAAVHAGVNQQQGAKPATPILLSGAAVPAAAADNRTPCKSVVGAANMLPAQHTAEHVMQRCTHLQRTTCLAQHPAHCSAACR